MNFIFSAAYLGISLVVVKLYFYLKEGFFPEILNRMFGMADVILFLCIGTLMEPEIMTCFFTFTFTLALCFNVVFRFKNGLIPLAAFMVLVYFGFLTVELFST